MKTDTNVKKVTGLKMLKRCVFATLLTVLAPHLFTPARADQQGYPYSFGSLTNIPAVLTNGQTVAASNNIIPLRSNSGIGLQAILGGTNSVSTNVTTVFVFTTVDNTNYATLPWAVWPIVCGGTNAVIANTNWNQLQLRGFAGLSLLVSNGTSASVIAGGFITNWSGGASVGVFPAGVDFNRPNQ